MSDAESKQIERMKSILADQKSAFRADRQRSLAERKADLAKIAKLCRDNVDAICEAINFVSFQNKIFLTEPRAA